MPRRVAPLVLGVALLGAGQELRAQVSLADDIILASKGEGEGKKGLKGGERTALGRSPGSNAGPFRNTPGSTQVLLGVGSAADLSPLPVSVAGQGVGSPSDSPIRPSQEPGRGMFQAGERPAIAPPPRPSPSVPNAIGIQEVPDLTAEGPPGGLTLDQAIAAYLAGNLELRTKFFELPMADADILTAGLRANPLFFYDTSKVPYGAYTESRPGAVESGISVVYPIDYSGKRRRRVEVSRRAKRVLEAQYQDAVRGGIDDLYTAFIDVLEARDAVLSARKSLAFLDEVLRIEARNVRRGREDERDDDGVRLERETTEILVEFEEDRLAANRRVLARLLNVPACDAGRLELRGSLDDRARPPPPTDQLIAIALECRPDVVAHQLGVDRARADLDLARADRLPDAYLLYTPFGYIDNSQMARQSISTWGAGVFVSIPLYNRNQGNVRRSRLNINQARAELEQVRRQAIDEVIQAAADYQNSRRHADRLRLEIYPLVARKRARAWRRFQDGQIDADAFFAAQRDYNSLVRHLRDSIVRHRRSMLALNTAVGRRILP